MQHKNRQVAVLVFNLVTIQLAFLPLHPLKKKEILSLSSQYFHKLHTDHHTPKYILLNIKNQPLQKVHHHT